MKNMNTKHTCLFVKYKRKLRWIFKIGLEKENFQVQKCIGLENKTKSYKQRSGISPIILKIHLFVQNIVLFIR
jgi:hypothetical protein